MERGEKGRAIRLGTTWWGTRWETVRGREPKRDGVSGVWTATGNACAIRKAQRPQVGEGARRDTSDCSSAPKVIRRGIRAAEHGTCGA